MWKNKTWLERIMPFLLLIALALFAGQFFGCSTSKMFENTNDAISGKKK